MALVFRSIDWRTVVAASALLCSTFGVQAALPSKFVPSDFAQPICPAHYSYSNGTCTFNAESIKEADDAKCKVAGLTYNASTKKCTPSDPKAPTAQCKALDGFTAKLEGDGAAAKCTYEATLASSAPGDYIGDCFDIRGVPPGSTLQADQTYAVTAQRNTDNDDRELTLVPGKVEYFRPFLRCKSTGGPQTKVTASALMESGAHRQGYAYGFLTMPYKYYPSLKSFEASVPLGGYFGWRRGQAGSGSTVAMAVTLSTVKAKSVDPNTLDANGKPTVTGDANVAALSVAAGMMFDVLKSPRGRPFKAGVFIGRDHINTDPTVDYRFNRKTWIAVQIGYDFTDN